MFALLRVFSGFPLGKANILNMCVFAVHIRIFHALISFVIERYDYRFYVVHFANETQRQPYTASIGYFRNKQKQHTAKNQARIKPKNKQYR